MHQKKMLLRLNKLEKEKNILEKKLKNHPIFKNETGVYLGQDKESFQILWSQYIIFFDTLKKIISKCRYRKYFIFRNYNKLILRKYALVTYFDTILDIDEICGEHNEFIRIFLEENFRKDYGYYAKYIYRPGFINLINTPNIFITPFERYISPKVFRLLDGDVLAVKNKNRLEGDYQNIFFYIKRRLDKCLFKISRRVGMVIAATKFSTRKKGLISKPNLEKYLKQAQVGDILLTRGNWNASNISIPGFWKHMSMYLGDGKIIEATGQGILIKPMEELTGHNDYLGVFRTNFSKDKIKRVVKSIKKHVGKGYDHRFNFYSDKFLVCSELVLKSYAKEFSDDQGIDIRLEHIGISLTFPPNNLVKLVENRKYLEPVLFIDSIEKTGKNFISTPQKLLESKSRSRFSFLLK